MEVLWFCLIASMIAAYVILDGFDLGSGILHLAIARNDDERKQVLKSIGPFWDGNELWLVASGGVMFFAFPALYASGFSGFYLPLTIVLWLLILRGISIESRKHLTGPLWAQFWDAVFFGASALLAIVFGTALGNVVRGVPLNNEGDFFLPLWTHWRTTGGVGILDWYTVLAGLLAFTTLTMHGGAWLYYKTEGELQSRARRATMWAAIATIALTTIVTPASFGVQPQLAASFSARPWGLVFPLLAAAGMAGVFLYLRRRRDLRVFLASCTYIAGMLASVVFGVFPNVLPASTNVAHSLTVYNSATSAYGLAVGLAWWIPGILLVAGYFIFSYRLFGGKVSAPSSDGH